MNLAHHFTGGQQNFTTPVSDSRKQKTRKICTTSSIAFKSEWKYKNEVFTGESHRKVGEYIRDLYITHTLSGTCKVWRGLHIHVLPGFIDFKCPHVNCKRKSIEWRYVNDICQHMKTQHFDEHCQINDELCRYDELDVPHHSDDDDDEEEEEKEEMDGFKSEWKYKNEAFTGESSLSHRKVGEYIRDLYITHTLSGTCKVWRGLHIHVLPGFIDFKCPHVNCKRKSIEWRYVNDICQHMKTQHFDEHCQINDELCRYDELDVPHHSDDDDDEEEEEKEEMDGFKSEWKYKNEAFTGESHRKVGEYIRDLYITHPTSGICKVWRGLHITVVRKGDIRFKCPQRNCKRKDFEWRSVKEICRHLKGQHFDEHRHTYDELSRFFEELVPVTDHNDDDDKQEEEEVGKEEIKNAIDNLRKEKEEMGEEEIKSAIDNLRNEINIRLTAVMRYMTFRSIFNTPLYNAGCDVIAETVLDHHDIRETIINILEADKAEEKKWKTDVRGEGNRVLFKGYRVNGPSDIRQHMKGQHFEELSRNHILGVSLYEEEEEEEEEKEEEEKEENRGSGNEKWV